MLCSCRCAAVCGRSYCAAVGVSRTLSPRKHKILECVQTPCTLQMHLHSTSCLASHPIEDKIASPTAGLRLEPDRRSAPTPRSVAVTAKDTAQHPIVSSHSVHLTADSARLSNHDSDPSPRVNQSRDRQDTHEVLLRQTCSILLLRPPLRAAASSSALCRASNSAAEMALVSASASNAATCARASFAYAARFTSSSCSCLCRSFALRSAGWGLYQQHL